MNQFRRISRDILYDKRGNVALIGAIAVIPLLALIGGGLDASRAYMARTQLQSACDAGVLAGRRAMSSEGTYGSAEVAKAKRMFDFNFIDKTIDATGVSFVSSANDKGQVLAIAKATLPTAVMYIFGVDKFDLTTECMAELQVANADVMFVLDTTGSMSGPRIAGLRDAVKDFHRTMNEAITNDETRIRYGFVPYSMAVNAGGLVSSGAMPASYFVDLAPYESREAQFNTPVHVGTTAPAVTTYETYSSTLSNANCTKYGNNTYPSNNGQNPATTGSAPGKVTTKTYSYGSWAGSGNSRTCTRKVVTEETTYQTKFAFSNWRYKQTDLDTSMFKAGSSVTVGRENIPTVKYKKSGTWYEDYDPSAFDPSVHTYADQAGYYDMIAMAKKNGSILHNVNLVNQTWGGCLEERDTVDDADWDPVPGGAHDLDLDSAPTSEATRWRPMWPDQVYLRNHQQHEDAIDIRANAYYKCPSPMKLFTEAEMSSNPNDVPAWLDNYLTGLVAVGNTYHDIGMIWGGRLSSPRGIFASNVNKDDKAVSRHLIFMTDGQMEPYIWGYNSYGIETLSNRIAPKNSDTATVSARHTARLLAACKSVKDMGITVWVIAFGTSLTSDLVACSSDGRAYKSDNTEQLKARFKFIATQVANLRLGK